MGKKICNQEKNLKLNNFFFLQQAMYTLQHRLCSNCHTLNATFIVSSANSEIALLSPFSAPGVFHDPKRDIILLSVPHNQHHMIGYFPGVVFVLQFCVLVNASLKEYRRNYLRCIGRGKINWVFLDS